MILDCWNNIGVRGDSSCPELDAHVHCRNCPKYSAAAADSFDIEVPLEYTQQWTKAIAKKRPPAAPESNSVVVFRIGDERFALPTGILREIVDSRRVHAFPHRRTGALLGLVSVRGELLICVSLRRILGQQSAVEADRAPSVRRAAAPRLLVVEREASRYVLPVEEIYGIERYHPAELQAVPASREKGGPAFAKAVMPWQQHSVGLLDEELLFVTIDRSLTSTPI